MLRPFFSRCREFFSQLAPLSGNISFDSFLSNAVSFLRLPFLLQIFKITKIMLIMSYMHIFFRFLISNTFLARNKTYCSFIALDDICLFAMINTK